MLPIRDLCAASASRVRFVLFDIDDTITKDGYLLRESYEAIWALREAGLQAVPVTGRPAGWCDLIARQWPVAGVVGENGAFAMFQKNGSLERMYHPLAPEPRANAERLAALGGRAMSAFPGLRVAKDQPFRLFDLALDFAEEEPNLGLDTARRVREFCVNDGAVAKVSSIHVNAWYGAYDKLSMAERFLELEFGYDPARDEDSVVYFGDSPNDEPMFRRYSLSCGVGNVQSFAEFMEHPPKYVTSLSYGYGFAEGVGLILKMIEKR
ncbi:MAG: HAD-IIB family hydrolase [Spirochaetales bacterium]|nr:HAD-IIB family hydrolase [Spirochaetales bacterium]